MTTRATKMRWGLGVFLFVMGFVAYMDRVNLSVAAPMIMEDFGFDKVQFGLVQTFFFVGYSLMQVPGGLIAERFGPRKAMTLAISWWSAFTFFTAYATNFLTFGIVRALFGIGEGPLYPGGSVLVSKWFSKKERGTANSFILAGSFVGPVLAPALTVSIMTAFGWRAVFVVFGVFGFLAALGWWLLARDNPAEHPWVNQAELAKITEDQEATAAQVGPTPVAPLGKFLRSVQFWAIGVQYFVTDYIMYVYLSWLPLYLMEAQHFSLKEMGIMASFPWLALCIITLTTGYISDWLVARGISVAKVRVYFGVTGLVVSSGALYMAAISGKPLLTVAWLTLSLGVLGFTFNASWASCNDLGQKFTGTVSGWMNLCGNLGGVVAPTLTAVIATQLGWQAALVFTSVMGLFGVGAWFLVKPDVPLATGSNLLKEIENVTV